MAARGTDTEGRKVRLARLRKEAEERAALAARYDWYGDECGCPCGPAARCRDDCPGCGSPLPLGRCRTHPRARPNQRPPGSHRASDPTTDWRIWLIQAGRFFGKTRSAAEFINREVESGRVRWVGLVNATTADVRDVQIEHPYSGLIALAPPWFKPVFEPSKKRVTWPNGAFATIYTAEEPGNLRGPGFNIAWCDEIGKWESNQRETWDNLLFCLREITEPRSRVVLTTTPQPSPTYLEIVDDPETVLVRGESDDNRTNVDPRAMSDLLRRYGGTRLGEQELRGVLLRDTPGALWKTALLESCRRDVPPGVGLVRVVVGVDPAGSVADMARFAAGVRLEDRNDGDQAGIVVAGLGSDGHAYVLADLTTRGSPAAWGAAVASAVAAYAADRVVAEVNHGGATVEKVLRAVDRHVPYRAVHASRGKYVRAEPVAALYERGLVHHVGYHGDLERQMTDWKPGRPSPDRLDALAFAITDLMLGGGSGGSVAVGVPRPQDAPLFYGG